jgi:hypothetical protein
VPKARSRMSLLATSRKAARGQRPPINGVQSLVRVLRKTCRDSTEAGHSPLGLEDLAKLAGNGLLAATKEHQEFGGTSPGAGRKDRPRQRAHRFTFGSRIVGASA